MLSTIAANTTATVVLTPADSVSRKPRGASYSHEWW